MRQDAGVSLFGVSLMEVDACPGPGPGPKKSHSYYHVAISPPHLHPSAALHHLPKTWDDSSPSKYMNREKSMIILVLTYYSLKLYLPLPSI